MKEKKYTIITIVLIVALAISLCGNVYLIIKQSGIKNQLTDADNLLAEANNRIADLENQLSDYENLKTQIADLQEQITQSNEQIETLENSLAEKDAQIEADKALAEQIKKEAETGTQAHPTGPKPTEVRYLPAPPDGVEDILGGPGEINENTPGYWDVDGSTLGEGGTINTDGLIVH